MNYHNNMDNNISLLLDKAYKLHTKGELSEAKVLYEQILNIDSSNLEVINLYAQLNVALKNYDTALEFFNKLYSVAKLDDVKINIAKVYIYKQDYINAEKLLLEADYNNSIVAALLAYLYMQSKNYEKAISHYIHLSQISPDNFSYYYNVSVCYSNLNNMTEALNWALKAYELNQSDFDIQLQLAHLYDSTNDRKNAILFLTKIAERVTNPDVCYRLGVLHKLEGNYEIAVSYFDKVIQINPDNKDAMLNIAATYRYINKENSLSIYKEIQTIYPDDLNILFCMYNLYNDMLNFEGALETALTLLSYDSSNPLYNSMTADAYLELYEYEKAIQYYILSIKYNPNDISSKCSLAYAYSCHRDTDKAFEILENLEESKAVKQDLTILNLRKRNFERAAEYFFEWHTMENKEEAAAEKARKYFYKLKVGEKYGVTEEYFTQFRTAISSEVYDRLRTFRKKLLKNQDFTGKNVLIYSGHGVGDFLMFARYLNILKKIAKHVIISVPNSLVNILQYSFPDIEVVNDKDAIPEDKYDYAGPEMCLIYYLKTGLKEIPFSDKYIDVQNNFVEEKSKLDVLNTQKKKVGIFWQGNPTTLRNRSVKLKYFLPLLEMENIQFYSFQISNVDFESHDLKQDLPLVDLSQYINNYTDTAALLKNMDLLITIDTSIAHLAGAMGLKTYLLLPYDAEWRWFYDEQKTDWYDSITIFKQQNPKSWEEVIDRVKLNLINL